MIKLPITQFKEWFGISTGTIGIIAGTRSLDRINSPFYVYVSVHSPHTYSYIHLLDLVSLKYISYIRQEGEIESVSINNSGLLLIKNYDSYDSNTYVYKKSLSSWALVLEHDNAPLPKSYSLTYGNVIYLLLAKLGLYGQLRDISPTKLRGIKSDISRINESINELEVEIKDLLNQHIEIVNEGI